MHLRDHTPPLHCCHNSLQRWHLVLTHTPHTTPHQHLKALTQKSKQINRRRETTLIDTQTTNAKIQRGTKHKALDTPRAHLCCCALLSLGVGWVCLSWDEGFDWLWCPQKAARDDRVKEPDLSREHPQARMKGSQHWPLSQTTQSQEPKPNQCKIDRETQQAQAQPQCHTQRDRDTINWQRLEIFNVLCIKRVLLRACDDEVHVSP